MTPDELRSFLTQRGAAFEEREIQFGTEFRCSGGEVFRAFPKRGRVVVQGAETALAREVKAWSEAGIRPASLPEAGAEPLPEFGPARRVFIVHGHDHQSRDQLELILRRWGLEPIVLHRAQDPGYEKPTGEFPVFEGVADGEWVEDLARVVSELAAKAGQADYRNRDGLTTEVQAESLAVLSKVLGACVANREREAERAQNAADAQAAAANGEQA